MRSLLLFLVALLLLHSVSAKQVEPSQEEFSIDVLNVRKGLLSNFVTKVVSDENNLKFFATEGGISKFDGYSFTDFRPGEEYPGLENENIEILYKDNSNKIWIGTKEGGLSVMNTQKQTIRNMNHVFSSLTDKKLRVISIQEDGDGKIWVGTWSSGLFVLDPFNELITQHFPFEQPVYNIIKDRYDNIWFLAGNGLNKFDPSEKRRIRYQTKSIYYNLAEDTLRNKIWLIGNKGKIVALGNFDYELQSLEEELLPLQASYVKSLAIDNKNRIWLGSWGDGLYISDPNAKNFRKINTNPQGGGLDNINYSIILSIDIDENGVAWLGTSHGGVLILYPNKGFEISRIVDSGPIPDFNITSFFKDSQGNSYKGTLTKGVFTDQNLNDFSRLREVIPSRINCFFESEQDLYIGTGQGLYIVKNKNFNQIEKHFKNQKITAVHVDRKNRLWLGTQQLGLKMMDSTQNLESSTWIIFSESSSEHPLTNNRISQIKESESGEIWLGTYSGINKYDEQSGNFIPQEQLTTSSLPPSIINDMHLIENFFYLGTPKGILVLKRAGSMLEVVESFDRSSGLTNDFICAIEDDLEGNLWISTTTTLTKFNPSQKTFINYDREDGVMINSFHIGASFKDSKGLLFFGGSNGLISFDPSKISEQIEVPEVVLTKLIVNNKSLNVGDEVGGKVILDNSIENTQKIELDYSQNHLSLTFTVNDFLGPDNIFYSYKLKGLQDEWVTLGSTNQISFTGLRWGDYELLLRASRNNQDWSPERSLLIQIDSPPWLTWWAFLAYFLLVSAILFLIRYVTARQARLEAELRIIQIEKEKDHELSEAKITFFTNISHEFRTPLTLILSPITELLSNFDLKDSVKEKLLLVESNGKRMLDLINQLLDFRKSEHGLLKLNLTHSDFIGFVREVYLSFKGLAIKKQISYDLETEIDSLYLEFDRSQMEIVICNLLSNAFKYTKVGGEIKLSICCLEDSVRVSVKDNGIGMNYQESKLVFDRFYQVQNAETSNLIGSGIGLAFSKNIVDLHHGEIDLQSEPGLGTCIYFSLPIKSTSKQGNLRESVSETSKANSMDLDFEHRDALKINQENKEIRILIADDNEDIRVYLRSLLSEEYDILEAEDGEQALDLIQKEFPDLLISDVMMPKMDGIKLCHEVKSQINTSHIPVILLTARTSMAYEMDGLQTGAEDYITKPFNPAIVKTRVKTILENRKKLREYYLNKVRFEPDTKEVFESDLDAQFIEKAISLVNTNLLNENFGIETMVDELCMSQSTLFRKIKSLTGLSITAFIRSVKLKKGAQLILQTDYKLSQVAYEVGFNDYKYFKKSFQQQFGCLPSDYKSLILQKAE
ncbi:hybrid sensor histidine kinase/response regulator transcription factor [Algoriphagus formosus]|uniref:hybrid sensor histidine kinase/response regulator transcription factor n=1 Tax=Algoriphagus formosus TaxID=2007308 RepID=UPI000C288EC1|nr:response regulator [Algoriphagus formosus]